MQRAASIDPGAVYRLAGTAGCDPRTARGWLTGRNVKGWSLAARLEIAAEQLGIERSGR